MLTAQMDLPETVLRDAGGLQQHLVERGLFALRDVLQGLGRERVAGGTQAWLDLLAGFVEPLRDDVDVDGQRVVVLGGICGQGGIETGGQAKSERQSDKGGDTHRFGSFPIAGTVGIMSMNDML